jgi:phosphonate metabolism protein (transferase hexapeptide repeat family)
MKVIDYYPPVVNGKMKLVLGEEPHIHPSCVVIDSRIGSWAALGENTCLVESDFADYSYTAGNVQIIYSEIGKFCSIANSVRINPGNHPKWRVTQHHMTYRRTQYGLGEQDDLEFFQWRKDHKCVIGHDVWLGHGVVVMPGVTIGTGAVVGSGAVVTRDIGPYEIAVGVPARVIKKRFDEETIRKILGSEWWNWSREKLESNFSDLLNPEEFIQKHG